MRHCYNLSVAIFRIKNPIKRNKRVLTAFEKRNLNEIVNTGAAHNVKFTSIRHGRKLGRDSER